MMRAPIAVLISVVLALPTGSYAAVIAREDDATSISAYGDAAIWSSSKGGEYRLRIYAGGATKTMHVASRTIPFDADLGRDAGGRIVAVYSRCATEQSSFFSATGCDVYKLDLATGKERKVRGVSTKSASEYLPTIDGDRIAFVRRYERRPGIRGAIPHLKLYNARTKKTKALPGGTNSFYKFDTAGVLDYGGESGPRTLDLGRRGLVIGWEYEPQQCPDDFVSRGSEIWLVSLTGERTSVTAGVCGDPAINFSPAISGGEVIYLNRSRPTVLKRFDPATSRYADAGGYEGAIAVSGSPRLTFDVRRDPSGKFEIVRSVPDFG